MRLIIPLAFVLLLGCAGPSPESQGEWNLQTVRAEYTLPLTPTVSIGYVEEGNSKHHIAVGRYVPLHVSNTSQEWAKVYSIDHTDTTFEKEITGGEIISVLENLGLSTQGAKNAGVSRITFRASGRVLTYIHNRALLEDVLNTSDYPLAEIESLQARIETGEALRMCLLEERADEIALIIRASDGPTLRAVLERAINARSDRGELSVRSLNIDHTRDQVTVSLRGNFVLRRLWGLLLKTRSNKIVIVWDSWAS